MSEDVESATACEVAVVIVTHNSRDTIGACLDSLDEGMKGIAGWKVVVVDNDSSDDTLNVAREALTDVEVVQTGRNAGYAAAINMGTAHCADSSAVLILNPDVHLGAGCAVALLDVLEPPGVGIAVPPLLDADGSLSMSQRRRPTVVRALAESLIGATRVSGVGTLGEIVGDAAQYEARRPVDWATGALMMVSRRCLDEVGDWDESFFLYSEETDFCLRASDHGYATWFTPEGASVHIGGDSTVSPYLWSLVASNRVLAYRKRHGRVATLLFRLALLLGELLRSVGGSPRHRAAVAALCGRPVIRV